MPRRSASILPPEAPASPPPPPIPPSVRQIRTRRGWRWLQNGTVLSEVLREAGPTHSVFDVLAAAIRLHPAPRRVAMLGFGAGGTVAALRALGIRTRIDTIDLDPSGFHFLRNARVTWLDPVACHRGDAVGWLRRLRRRFDVIIEDLSIPLDGDVVKPEATWGILPATMARRLAPGGLAVFNLLPPGPDGWEAGLTEVTRPFTSHAVVHFTQFHNRVVLAATGETRLDAPPLSRQLRTHLRALGSNQSGAIRVEGRSRHPMDRCR